MYQRGGLYFEYEFPIIYFIVDIFSFLGTLVTFALEYATGLA